MLVERRNVAKGESQLPFDPLGRTGGTCHPCVLVASVVVDSLVVSAACMWTVCCWSRETAEMKFAKICVEMMQNWERRKWNRWISYEKVVKHKLVCISYSYVVKNVVNFNRRLHILFILFFYSDMIFHIVKWIYFLKLHIEIANSLKHKISLFKSNLYQVRYLLCSSG